MVLNPKRKPTNQINPTHWDRPEGPRLVPAVRPASEPTVQIVDVTPQLAKDWLELNTRNRSLRESTKVANFARDMAAGNWRPYVTLVVRATDGTLLDGQHRLHAIVVSGTTQRMIVVTGVPKEDQHVIDRNSKRTFADDLKIKGRKYHALVASITTGIMQYQRRSFVHKNWTPTETELHSFEATSQDELLRAAEVGSRCRSLLGVAPTPAGIAYYTCAQIDAEQAEWFFESLATGVGLGSNSPILALRNRMIRSRDPQRRERLTAAEQFAYYALAWNAVRQGRAMTRVQLPKGSLLSEKNLPRPT
jgi:hypothetical protein